MKRNSLIETLRVVHIYTANVEEEKVKSGLLKSFINSAFRGSTSSLVMQALGQSNASIDELNQIKSLIAQIENKK